MKLDRNTELARAVNVMMAQVKIIYILHFADQSKHAVFLFFVALFSKNRVNMFSVLLSSSRSARERLKEFEKAVETFACDWCSHSISRSPKLLLLLLKLRAIETLYTAISIKVVG